ncbi:hypothetical protein WJU16_23900 [Chitinophaga pollutisoli]|uniref:Uncharacterized protein n=1 Tax=Chitinophaga pollutisoli TaxID=3133966 RepID=A0ABZ2YNK8_9BACT
MQKDPSTMQELLDRWMSGQASEAEKEAFLDLLDRQGVDSLSPTCATPGRTCSPARR